MHRCQLAGRLGALYRLLCLIAVLLAGCVSPRAEVQKTPVLPVSNPAAADGPTVRPATAERVENPEIELLPPLSATVETPAPVSTNHVNSGPLAIQDPEDPAGRPLTLDDAIALAFERQARLRVYLEGIQQARGLSDIAFAPFLPTLSTGYSVGGYGLNVGGVPIQSGSLPGFTVLPPGFALPGRS